MSNLVPAFYELLSKMEENRMACGVILASCKNFSAESLELVKRDMEAQLADTMTMHFAHDKSKNILGILLEQKSSQTPIFTRCKSKTICSAASF